jgi:hypothetical protein
MTPLWWIIPALALVAGVLWLWRRIRSRSVMLWLPAYLKRDWSGIRQPLRNGAGPVHLMLCIADHFEPGLWGAGHEVARQRVQRWRTACPDLAAAFRDADGLPPRQTFFYAAEQYHPEHLDLLAELARMGYGEVEVHLHHDRDSSEGLRRTLLEFVARLRQHGLLGTDRDGGTARFAFVHGNWALDNSRPDGRWCGVNDELIILRECGCYADLTFPSAPSPTQPRRVNSIYYALDDPQRPRSHDDGTEVRVGGEQAGDLMIIQGPLAVRWPGGRLWVLPRLENGDISAGAPPTPARVAAWIRQRIGVAGRPGWVFVKLHTHGCKEDNWPVLFGAAMRGLHRCLTEQYNDGQRYKLHYVTAREMYNIIKAAEAGLAGDPGQYRDFAVSPPRACGR